MHWYITVKHKNDTYASLLFQNQSKYDIIKYVIDKKLIIILMTELTEDESNKLAEDCIDIT